MNNVRITHGRYFGKLGRLIGVNADKTEYTVLLDLGTYMKSITVPQGGWVVVDLKPATVSA